MSAIRHNVLVGGGVRSGKSAFALQRARELGRTRLFVATAQCLDDEMQRRANRHREERGAEFETVEEPRDLLGVLASRDDVEVVVVDCLTLWLSNLLLAGQSEEAIERQVGALCTWLSGTARSVVLVTNEVGLGVVPEHALARSFRDVSGRAHQSLGRVCSEVYFGALGQLIRLKPGPVEVVPRP